MEQPEERRPRPDEAPDVTEPAKRERPPETDPHPAPGIEHEPEPDAENIIPVEDGPGTF